MSYVTYTTRALVCGTFNRNTADRTYLLFTREAGMLYAEARSVREERSRQRYALQDFSEIRVSLVKGKQGWRVGSAETIHNDYTRAVSREARGSVVEVYRLLRRFIQGEEPTPDLYDFVIEALAALTSPLPARSFTEALVTVRVLLQLGYVDASAVPVELRTKNITDLVTLSSGELESKLRTIIEAASAHSHL